MSTEVQAREYQIGDEEKIVELLKSSFPIWQKAQNPIDYWRWKYLDSEMGSAIAVVATDEKVIGVWHERRLRIKFGSKIVSSHLGDDTATHPDFRGKGVYDKLDVLFNKWHAEEKLKYLYVITTTPIIIKWELKRGIPEFPHKISNMIRVRDIELHLKVKSVDNVLVVGSGLKVLKTLNITVGRIVPPLRRLSDFKVTMVSLFDERVNKFWDEISGSYSYILERKMDYLNWRYCDPRGGVFRVMQADAGGKMLGFVVIEIKETNGYSEGYIMDLLALPNRDDVVNALLEEACKYLDGMDVNAIHYQLVRGHPYQALSTRSNFIETSKTIDMHVFVTFTGAEEEFNILKTASPDKVYFNIGDYI